MAKKKVPVEKTLQLFSNPMGPIVSGINHVEGAHLLSVANRRMYEQHKVYRVKFDLPEAQLNNQVRVYTLKNSWFNIQALKLAKESYMKATAAERKLINKENKPKWSQFVIGSPNTWQTIPKASTFIRERDSDGNVDFPSLGSWSISSVENKDTGAGISYSMEAVTTPTKFGILKEYMDKGFASSTPTVVQTDAPYEEIQEMDMSDYEFERLQTNGQNPPYDINSIPNPWVLREITLTSSHAGESTVATTGWIDAPLGWVMIQQDAGVPEPATWLGTLYFAGGDYRGVYGGEIV